LTTAKVVILGLGNPVLTDDAVGLKVVERIEELLENEPVPGLHTLASTRAGFELIDLLTGYSHVFIVDAFLAENPEPGKVRWLTMDDVAGNVRLLAPHEVSIDVAFRLAEQMKIPMPSEVEIVGIEVKDIYQFSDVMTPVMQAVVEPVAQELFQRAKELTAKFSPVIDNGSPDEKRIPFYSP